MADRVEKHFVEDGKLLPHDPPDGEQWLDDQRESGSARDQLADPRFVHSRAVGVHVGLTPRRHQSGEIDYDGGISLKTCAVQGRRRL
jgi:hypothetical protein